MPFLAASRRRDRFSWVVEVGGMLESKATVVAIYTGKGLSEPFEQLFRERVPAARLVNIVDDGLIREVIEAGKVTPAVRRRLVSYYMIAEGMGARAIVNTCSSVGEVAEWARPLVSVPLLRIDEPMAKVAIGISERIAVLATLATTLEPTVSLVRRQARLLGKEVQVSESLAEGAYQALVQGRPEEHDQLLLDAAVRAAQSAQTLVLAQGSMWRMQQRLQQATGINVLASPPLCVEELRALMAG
jgi:aspartate/glutamate racemase